MFKSVSISTDMSDIEKVLKTVYNDTIEVEKLKGYEYLGRTVYIKEDKCVIILNFMKEEE